MNRFQTHEPPLKGLLKVDPAVGAKQVARLQELKNTRDNAAVQQALAEPRHGAKRPAQGVHSAGHLHLPPRPSMRLITDIFAYCRGTCPAGTPSASAATTSARPAPPPCRKSPSPWPTASPTSRPPSRAGLDVDEFAPRLSFFFNAHNDLFEEVAKFRAARRLWAKIMKERFRPRTPGP